MIIYMEKRIFLKSKRLLDQSKIQEHSSRHSTDFNVRGQITWFGFVGKLFLFPSRDKIPVPARQPEIARSHGILPDTAFLTDYRIV